MVMQTDAQCAKPRINLKHYAATIAFHLCYKDQVMLFHMLKFQV